MMPDNPWKIPPEKLWPGSYRYIYRPAYHYGVPISLEISSPFAPLNLEHCAYDNAASHDTTCKLLTSTYCPWLNFRTSVLIPE